MMAFQVKQLFFEKEDDGFTILIRDGAAENAPVLDSVSLRGEKFEEFLAHFELLTEDAADAEILDEDWEDDEDEQPSVADDDPGTLENPNE
jgi:hypothetical protein